MIILLLFIFISCDSSKNCQTQSFEQKVVKVISEIENDSNYESDSIYNIIPSSQDEYLVFYSLTYPESNVEIESFYFLINQLFNHYSKDDKVYIRLLELSNFADGEFAETYFESMYKLIEKDKNLFCKIFEKASKFKVNRLDNEYSKICDSK